MDRHERLEKWAGKALAYYNEVAPEIDLPFYQFQKPVDFFRPCRVLMIGLNPGWDNAYGTPNFEVQRENPLWKFGGQPQKMPMSVFLGGNPCLGSCTKWPIFEGLSLLGLTETILNADDCQYMNYIPFAAPNFNFYVTRDRKLGLRTFDRCRELTSEYIRILQPEKILVLGTANGIDKLRIDFPPRVIVRDRQRRIVEAAIEGVPACAIPHPSYSRTWPREAIEAMKSCLHDFFRSNVRSDYGSGK